MASWTDTYGDASFRLLRKEAIDAARKIQSDLEPDPVWEPALTNAVADEPQLVMRLDAADEYYYIVDFRRESKIVARMGIGGKSYSLLLAHAIDVAGKELPPFVNPAAYLAARQGTPWGLGAARDRIVREHAVGVHPLLAWKLCTQSHSPLFPFYLLTVNESVYYLRTDGKLFHELTRPLPGR